MKARYEKKMSRATKMDGCNGKEKLNSQEKGETGKKDLETGKYLHSKRKTKA
jgi:hypothetical protein